MIFLGITVIGLLILIDIINDINKISSLSSMLRKQKHVIP